jgi:uncharacterized protein
MTAIESLAESSYVLLTTFRKDGRPVATPVWAVRDDDALAIWTVAESGKVKRLRRSGQVTVAPCDIRGNPLGEPVTGQGLLLDAAGAQRVRRLIARKYGLMGRLTLLGSRMRRGRDGTTAIRVTF